MMFTHQLDRLKARQLALRLRNLELRAELHEQAQHLLKPGFGGLGIWLKGAAGITLLLTAWRGPGRLTRQLGLAKLALRLLRLVRG